MGTAGYAGAIAFGYLQRAANQYGSGIDHAALLGATAESVKKCNRVLAKSFLQAYAADDNVILTNLFSVDAIADWLQEYDALIMGTDLGVAVRDVTPGTYETRNEVTCEVYWPAPRNLNAVPENWPDLRDLVLRNVLEAARLVGLEHICLVDDAKDYQFLNALHASGVPYTCLGPTAVQMVDHPNYTCRMGVLEKLETRNLRAQQRMPSSRYLHREDVAALAVQALMSLDWRSSRCLAVTSNGKAKDDFGKAATRNEKTEWCQNSYILEEALGKKKRSYVY